jgi:hypothetical protein
MYPLIVDTSFTGAEGSVQTANGNGAVRGGGGTGNDDPG